MTNSDKNKETKEEKFVRVVEGRVQRVLDALRILGNTADTRRYSYDEKDVKKIFRAIDEELKRVKALYVPDKQKTFSLR